MTDDAELDETLERAKLACAAYQEGLHSRADVARMKVLRTELFQVEAEVTRLKRLRGSGAPSA